MDRTPDVTQRELSRRIGIALGLTNVLLRNLVQKGYVRVAGASWKRRLYSLTPSGFRFRVSLTADYVHRFLDRYQNVRETLRQELAPLALNEESRIAIYGTGEFAELIYLGLKDIDIEEMTIFGPNGTEGDKFLGMPVRGIEAMEPGDFDKVVIAVLGQWEQAFAEVQARGVPLEKVVTLFAESRPAGAR